MNTPEKRNPGRANLPGLTAGNKALAVGFGGGRELSRQPGSKRLLPMGADLRITALSADAGLQDRQTKATRLAGGPQVTVVGAPWIFSIAAPATISGPQNRVSRNERWRPNDKWSLGCHASQARATIGPADKSMQNRTAGHLCKLLIILLISVQNIDLLLTAPYDPPTFAHARVNPNAARKG
jgi:hypothetical protein